MRVVNLYLIEIGPALEVVAVHGHGTRESLVDKVSGADKVAALRVVVRHLFNVKC